LAWTLENLSLGNYVIDWLPREHMGYGGYAHAATRTHEAKVISATPNANLLQIEPGRYEFDALRLRAR
jgi:hypothetical protein